MIDKHTLYYLATPYTKYRRGLFGAFIDACKLAADLRWKHGIVVFSPIAHCHGMTTHGDLPPIDHKFWMEFNRPFIAACGGLLVGKLDGWDESIGIADELTQFRAAGKPVLFVDPETLEVGGQ